MPKFIELIFIEDREQKRMTINTDHIIYIRPKDFEDKKGTIVTLTKVYSSTNNTIRHTSINAIIEYEELRTLLSNL